MAWDSTKVEGDALPPAEWNAMVLYLKGKGNKVVVQTTAPTTAVDGEYWFDTTPGATRLNLKVAGAWVNLSITGATGPKGDTGSTGATGAKGDKGDTGAAGTAGTNGTDGADGKTVRYGTIPPTTEGADGDFYIDITAHMVYGPKAAGTWPAGTSMIGPAGDGGAGSGDVVGPATATDNAIARFDGSGKLLQNSLVTVDDAGSVNIPTGQAYKINGTALAAIDVGAAATTHDHTGTYLPAAGKAADADKLDGIDSTGFVQTTDPRLIDPRTPTAHSSTHATAGADALSASDIGAAATNHNHDTAYAPIAKGVTNGDSHDHNGGDGAQITYASLSGAPTSMAPTAHASTHATGQADALTPSAIGASASDHTHTDVYLPVAGVAADSSKLNNVAASGYVLTGDSRLSDTRTPTTHATSHKSGGGDAIKLDELAAPTDITTLNVSSTAHGLMPKLPGGTDTFYRADGTFVSVPISGSAGDLNFTDGKSLQLFAALGTDHTVSGITVTLTAAAAVTIGQVCYIDSSGQAALADGDAIATMPVRVMATGSIGAGSSGQFLILGYMRDDSNTYTVGGTIYASGTAGAITQTAPSGSAGVVQSLGYAVAAHIMFFNPGTYLELV